MLVGAFQGMFQGTQAQAVPLGFFDHGVLPCQLAAQRPVGRGRQNLAGGLRQAGHAEFGLLAGPVARGQIRVFRLDDGPFNRASEQLAEVARVGIKSVHRKRHPARVQRGQVQHQAGGHPPRAARHLPEGHAAARVAVQNHHL